MLRCQRDELTNRIQTHTTRWPSAATLLLTYYPVYTQQQQHFPLSLHRHNHNHDHVLRYNRSLLISAVPFQVLSVKLLESLGNAIIVLDL